MRHRKSSRRLPQKPAHGRMLKRNLVTSLLLYEQIRTTKKRAQVVAPLVDRLVAVAKSSSPHNAIRSINSVVTDKNACRKIMEVLVKRYADRSSGLTHFKPVGARKGDGAALVDLSLLEGIDVPAKAVAPKKATPKKKESKPTKKAS
ncbi:MAG: bL17 family ribosomal protein [Candidatus Peribacteraceae bacterium]|nr:bL17 family ribosomal protein [Candidatus Peribacteraceae bacterium]MDD5075109.1 bL17 family ribosomal protein [Candidatus Peribacteraceae bacterium]